MHPILRNILAAVAGIIFGGAINMGLISISGTVIPPPEGADVTTMEGLKAAMSLMQPKHFIFPFLAHALGTFFGAWLAAKLAATQKLFMALVVGAFFLLGGITNVFLLPAPIWYIILDLGLAYIPTAYIAGKLVSKK